MAKFYMAVAAGFFQLIGSPVPAETLTFEADDGVLVIRTYDQFGAAVSEFIGDPGAFYQCIALDDTGTPIASAVAMSDMGMIMFESLDASLIAEVKCRKTM